MRLPRVLLAALVGGGLAVVGAALQSVFRNPMADSGLLGVGCGRRPGRGAGRALGWAGEVFLALPSPPSRAPWPRCSPCTRSPTPPGGASLHGLLLTGLAVSALAGAGTSVLLVATEEFRVKTVLFWLAGGLEGRGWTHAAARRPLFILAGVRAAGRCSRAPSTCSRWARRRRPRSACRCTPTRLALLALAALVAGAATSVAGSVPFVGLVAPHALRPLVGPLGRHLLPASFLARRAARGARRPRARAR